MSLCFIPKTRLEKWAVGFGVVLVSLMVLELVFAIVIGGDPAVIENSAVLTIFAYALSVGVSVFGPLSFIIGIISFFKHKEWLIIASMAVLYGLTILLFILGELLFPH